MRVLCYRQNVPDMTDEEYQAIKTILIFNLKEVAEEQRDGTILAYDDKEK